MTDLAKSKEAIEETYNSFINVYDYGDHIRFTNGSAGMYIDIEYKNGTFYLTGKRYSEEINKQCNGTTEDLLTTLSHTV